MVMYAFARSLRTPRSISWTLRETKRGHFFNSSPVNVRMRLFCSNSSDQIDSTNKNLSSTLPTENTSDRSTPKNKWTPEEIGRRRKALALVLAEGENERPFFRCDHTGAAGAGAALLSAQFGLWGYLAYNLNFVAERASAIQTAVSMSALGFSAAALFAAPFLAKRVVYELVLLKDNRLRIVTHMPSFLGESNHPTVSLDDTVLLPLQHHRIMAIRPKSSAYNFLLDTEKGGFVGTDIEAFKSLMRSSSATALKKHRELYEFVHSTAETTRDDAVAGPSTARQSPFAVTRRRRILHFRNKRDRLGQLWRRRKGLRS